MNKTVFYIVFCWLSLPLFAQTVSESENLVPNGSFEEYNCCPFNGGDIHCSTNWFSPNNSSPDYFNPCNLEDFGVPYNFIGQQLAKDGNAYAGIAMVVGSEFPNYREYIQVKLVTPLKKERFYQFRCFISTGDFAEYCIKSIGVALTEFQLIDNSTNTLNFTPQLKFTYLDCNIENWVELTGFYLASGNEQFLTIGNFQEDNVVDIFHYNNEPNESLAYIYIDDVSLVETPYIVPNVFTPNNDGFNDFLVLEKIPDDFHLTILNRWGNVVFETEKPSTEFWDGTSKGKRCADGVYFYKLEKGNFIKNGFVHLIR